MKQRTWVVAALALAGLVSLAVLAGSRAQEEVSDPAAIIAANNAAFSAAYMRGDAKTIASLYTENGQLHPPGRTIEGRAAIERYFTLGPQRKVLRHSLQSEALDVAGDIAVESGVWTSTTRRADADPVTLSDRYLLVWKRQPDGRWLIDRDWWHRPEIPVATADARPLTVERAELRTLSSKINGVEYKLYVSLPHGHGTPGKRFPVIYTLDADYSFLIVRNITDHLSERNDLDEVIVVGIAYGGPLHYRLNRTRDYTPVFVPDGGYGPEYQKVSGGGPRFLQVIEKEIIPLIDASYDTLEGDRTLSGHSYGGLFTVWTMLSRPDLFQRYIAVSPSLWYDDDLMMRVEETFAKSHRALPVRAYFSVGSREGSAERRMVTDLQRLVKRLESRGYEGLALSSRIMDDETHNSVYPGAISDGLRFVFESR
ncbi:MAG TPA: alpha/beta hydrolase-fold protein [Thermoanaerobaculia bacterium]|nr:alpha/beta hydrolase-fold protein [Thermoanaerobaculia bacterium]